MKHPKIFIVIFTLVFLSCAAYLFALPRSSYSDKERRELAGFPEFSLQALADGSYTKGISSWFTDTVPGRDMLLDTAVAVKGAKGLPSSGEDDIHMYNLGGMIAEEDDEEILIRDTDEIVEPEPVEPEPTVAPTAAPTAAPTEKDEPEATATPTEIPTPTGPDHENLTVDEEFTPDIEEAFTRASNGIIITGSGDTTRAIMMYGGSTNITTMYAECANHYHEVFPDVKIYCLVIPTAVAFYCPESVRGYTGSELKQINNVIEHLDPEVYSVQVYTTLAEHSDENIFLRTDHHWAPLGAYYAAQEIARVAGVPFMDLSEYEERVVHRYVGTMYMYSQDPQVLNNPEDFVYYVPQGVEYETTFINYSGGVEMPPVTGNYFYHMNDGNSNAYSTFMGGDAKITQVRTSTKNGRKLIIMKDSFGNAIPSFLFGSFEEIHVIDCRYFKKNMVQYVEENGITDILFANNAFHASVTSTINAYERFLTQNAPVSVNNAEETVPEAEQ
ncbi:MAG: hypothetical protein IKI75_09140 [Lachnospiraceae bacterium]|nr:hypothetical protein [Lachnospiraceae bacterium]